MSDGRVRRRACAPAHGRVPQRTSSRVSAKRISAPIVDDEEESDDFADTPKAKPRARAPAKKVVAEHDVESISEGAYARAALPRGAARGDVSDVC